MYEQVGLNSLLFKLSGLLIGSVGDVAGSDVTVMDSAVLLTVWLVDTSQVADGVFSSVSSTVTDSGDEDGTTDSFEAESVVDFNFNSN